MNSPKGIRTYDGTLWVSDWMKGTIFRITSKGKAKTILELEKRTADIGYILKKRTLLIPHNKQNRIIAYKLGSSHE